MFRIVSLRKDYVLGVAISYLEESFVGVAKTVFINTGSEHGRPTLGPRCLIAIRVSVLIAVLIHAMSCRVSRI